MAIHNHELFEEPDLYYEHAFNTGDPLELARAIRAALNNTNTLSKPVSRPKGGYAAVRGG